SVGGARSGELMLMVGGAAEDLDRARSVLDRLSRRIFHMGELGTGAAMKLAVNTVIYGLNGAISEAIVLAEHNSIDRATAYEVLANNAVAAPFVQYKRAAFVDPESTPVAFSLALAEKDLRLIDQLATESGTPMPQAAVNLDAIRAAEASIGPEADFAGLARHLRHEART